jgi:hypothetical protein
MITLYYEDEPKVENNEEAYNMKRLLATYH